LQVLDEGNVLTLSVKEVKCFFFFDPKKNRYRKFFTLSVPIHGTIDREIFLEYVYGNERVSILNHKTMGLAHAYMGFTPFKQPSPVSKQYLLNCLTGTLMPISRDNALTLITKKPDVAAFIESHDIRFKKI